MVIVIANKKKLKERSNSEYFCVSCETADNIYAHVFNMLLRIFMNPWQRC